MKVKSRIARMPPIIRGGKQYLAEICDDRKRLAKVTKGGNIHKEC